MIDRGVPNAEDWPEGVRDSLRSWEQGDLVATPPFFYFADPQHPVWEATRQYTATSSEPEIVLPEESLCPPYAMVTTQTCDIAEEDSARPLRPWVQLAPVYEVTGWKRKKLEGGRGPRYWLLVPELPGENPHVADLRIEVPVEKGWLAQQQRVIGFADEAAKQAVGDRLRLLRGRYAFAREVNQLVSAIWELLDASNDDNDDATEILADAIEEVGLLLDSYLYPTHIQVVFLTTLDLDEKGHDRLEAWRDSVASELQGADITLQRHDVRALAALAAADYRKMAIVWRR
jgi:hypothetical protein